MKNSENPSRRLHSLLITLLLTVSCASCLYIPHIRSSGEKGIADDSLAWIEPGKTTKEEVLLAFGCPISESQTDEFTTFTYEWSVNLGYWGFAIPLTPYNGAVAVGTVRRDYSLTVQFDSSNRVIKCGVEKRDTRETTWGYVG